MINTPQQYRTDNHKGGAVIARGTALGLLILAAICASTFTREFPYGKT
jgi:hypothetical protein